MVGTCIHGIWAALPLVISFLHLELCTHMHVPSYTYLCTHMHVATTWALPLVISFLHVHLTCTSLALYTHISLHSENMLIINLTYSAALLLHHWSWRCWVVVRVEGWLGPLLVVPCGSIPRRRRLLLHMRLLVLLLVKVLLLCAKRVVHRLV